MFIGRESELDELNALYREDAFQLVVMYGRRRVGKTTLLNEFCKGKEAIFFPAEQSNDKLNLEKFSRLVFQYYHEETLEPFASWEKALMYIHQRQNGQRLVLIFDEFPYLAKQDMAILSMFQHVIDHVLRDGRLFIVLCGSYMSFMEKKVLGSKSPIFGRRTAQFHLKSFDYRTSLRFVNGFSQEDKLKLYGAYGGTAMYLAQISSHKSFEANIKDSYLRTTAYLYEEPLLLLRQEVQEPGIYNAIIAAIACGASKANEIATKISEPSPKCLKYINTLCELGIIYKETPFGEKESSRKTIYRIADFMFRFWYRYVFSNRLLIETGARDIIWTRTIANTYSDYMGTVFERICREYLLCKNSRGELPILFTGIGRWWGTNPTERSQVEIDIIAKDGDDYLFCECKWQNEKAGIQILRELQKKADIFSHRKGNSWYVLFSKSGFTEAVLEEAKKNNHVILVDLHELVGQA